MSAKNLQSVETVLVSAAKPIKFGKYPDFAKIPDTLLATIEERIKELIDAELPFAIVKVGNLARTKTITAGQAPMNQSTVPSLTINMDCCPAQTFGKDIAQGYVNAAHSHDLQTSSETALLTIKKVSARTGNLWRANTRGENKVEAILTYRGNEYLIEETASFTGTLNDVGNAEGKIAFEKLRTIQGVPSSKSKNEKDTSAFPIAIN